MKFLFLILLSFSLIMREFAEDSEWNECQNVRTKGKMREKGGGRWLDDETDGRKLIFSSSCLSKTGKLENWKDGMSPKIGRENLWWKIEFPQSVYRRERAYVTLMCVWNDEITMEKLKMMTKGKVEQRLDFPSFLSLWSTHQPSSLDRLVFTFVEYEILS